MPRKSILEVKVLDVQKRRIPNKHYVSASLSVYVCLYSGWAGLRVFEKFIVTSYSVHESEPSAFARVAVFRFFTVLYHWGEKVAKA